MKAMPWSDDMRCLYCDGKLPLYRKITNGQFCSATHRKAYWHEQERLAVERLHQTHDSLRSYIPPVEGNEDLIHQLASPVNPYYLADPEPEPAPPTHAEEVARKASNTDHVATPGFLVEARFEPRVWFDHPSSGPFVPLSWPLTAPLVPVRTVAPDARNIPVARPVGIPLLQRISPVLLNALGISLVPQEHSTRVAPTLANLASSGKPDTPELTTALAAPKAVAEPEPEAAPQIAMPAPLPVVPMAAMETATVLAASPVDVTPEIARPMLDANVEEIAQAAPPARATMARVIPIRSSIAETQSAELPMLEPPLADPVRVAESTLPSLPNTTPRANIEALIHKSLPRTIVPMLTSGVAEPMPLPVAVPVEAAALPSPAASDLEGVSPRFTVVPALALPETPLAIEAASAAEQDSQPEEQVLPMAEKLAGLGGIAPRDRAPLFAARIREVLPQIPKASSALLTANFSTPALSAANLHAVSLGAVAAPANAFMAASAPKPYEIPADAPEFAQLATQGSELTPRFAPGARYAVERQAGVIAAKGLSEPAAMSARAVAPRIPANLSKTAMEPQPARLRKLTFRANPIAPDAPENAVEVYPASPAADEPMLPNSSRLDVAQGLNEPPPRRGFFESWTIPGADGAQHMWSQAAGFWADAPRDLKLLAVAIPILLGLALHPSLPKVRVSAPVSAGNLQNGIQAGFANSLRAQLVSVRQSVAERAGVDLNEDFRSGLDDWQTRGDLSTAWSFDQTGFVKPGALALYRPSLRLNDYDAQFLGLIDKKALSFVARAQDFDNYQVIKLALSDPGPLPTLKVVRYAVVDGKPGHKTETVAPINARPDMLYRVDLNVHGDTFLLVLQGIVADSWTEPRLTHGGIGFFAGRGEQSRLRWVQVTHQYDMLGRLCAYLAPYNIPTTNGSW